MTKQSMNLVSPAGTLIVATLERLTGRALIVSGSARPDTIGGFEIDYEGTTEIDWDEQQTVKRDDERVFLDEEGDEFLETELKLVPSEQAPSTEAERVITVTMDGGLIQAIEGIPSDLKIRVVDFDIDGAEPERISTLPSGEKACVSEWGSSAEDPP